MKAGLVVVAVCLLACSAASWAAPSQESAQAAVEQALGEVATMAQAKAVTAVLVTLPDGSSLAITLGGKEYPKGILLHPAEGADGKGVGRVTYVLAGPLSKARRFQATIGVDDAVERYGRGSVTFIVEVLRDGKWQQLYASPVLKLADKPLTVGVDIAGAQQLRLITTDGGDGIACDHAEWADARLN